MENKKCVYEKLIEYKRGTLIEQVHYGLIVHVNKSGIINKIGNDNGYKFYHRSCMKPLQAAMVFDLKLDEKYHFSLEEIALFGASHTGDIIHQEKVLSVLEKIGLKEDDLLCHEHSPLSKKEQIRLLKSNLPERKIHNNCSGKHAAMLTICKNMNYPLSNYKDMNHPLTKLILNRVCELCEINYKDLIVSKDGCGLPVLATPLENLAKGFLNLFTDIKYKKLTDAFLKYPYLIGGEGRLDSEIINFSDNLIAKVGACGLCCVVNLEKNECIVVKIADSNMEARSIAVISALSQLKWLKDESCSRLNKLYTKEILSQDGDILGMISPCFNITKQMF